MLRWLLNSELRTPKLPSLAKSTPLPYDSPVSSSIELRAVSVTLPDGRKLIDDVSLAIDAGESVSLIGRSGAGKTTMLRLLNGLASASAGEIRIDDSSLADSDLVALRRKIGYIVQGVGLFPHRTVYDNVATVPRLLEWDEPRIEPAVREALDRVSLPNDDYASRFPHTLSGGEQQRVGIARALVFEPDILLCDEPFGALDPIVRREQQELYLSSRKERPATTVFVTHDLSEALLVAERIVLVDAGRIVADAPSKEFTSLDIPLVRAFVDAARLPAVDS